MTVADLTSGRHSPSAVRMPGAWGLLAQQTLAEVRQTYRTPEYAVGIVVVPAILYAMFALPHLGRTLPAGTEVSAIMVGSFAAYGVVSLSIFTFGVDVAHERGKGWLRRLRATPMPMWAYFTAKILMAMVYAAVIVALIIVVALVAGVHLDPWRLARTVAVLIVGTVAFCTMGSALAYWFRPKAASAVGNLVFLPLSFLSGFFYSLADLPPVFADLARFLPTYHFGQLVWGQIAPAADVAAFGSPAPGATWVHMAWIVGCFVVFGALTVIGYRREARRERW